MVMFYNLDTDAAKSAVFSVENRLLAVFYCNLSFTEPLPQIAIAHSIIASQP